MVALLDLSDPFKWWTTSPVSHLCVQPSTLPVCSAFGPLTLEGINGRSSQSRYNNLYRFSSGAAQRLLEMSLDIFGSARLRLLFRLLVLDAAYRMWGPVFPFKLPIQSTYPPSFEGAVIIRPDATRRVPRNNPGIMGFPYGFLIAFIMNASSFGIPLLCIYSDFCILVLWTCGPVIVSNYAEESHGQSTSTMTSARWSILEI